MSAIVDHFEALLTSPPDIGGLDVDPSRSDAVRLMNLHQVKGLEAPVVFLIDPSEPYEFPIDLFVDRSEEEYASGHSSPECRPAPASSSSMAASNDG